MKPGTNVAMAFPAASGALYMLAPSATDGHIREQISAKLYHLNAMLMVTCGSSGHAFREDLSESSQDNFMWACSAAAVEISELFDKLTASKGEAV